MGDEYAITTNNGCHKMRSDAMAAGLIYLCFVH